MLEIPLNNQEIFLYVPFFHDDIYNNVFFFLIPNQISLLKNVFQLACSGEVRDDSY